MSRRGSPLDSEPCKQCKSFSDYVKTTKKNLHTTDPDKSAAYRETPPERQDCPLDRDELGNSSWGVLHTIASKYPEAPTKSDKKQITEFFRIFSNLYPCEECAKDFREELKRDPIQVSSQEALSQWLCKIHNKVNVKLNKEVFDCSKVNERWRDGWRDGSCDF